MFSLLHFKIFRSSCSLAGPCLLFIYHPLAHSWRLIMPLSLRQANLSYQVPCITFPLSSMPSHFWPNLSYSSRFTWVPCPPRSLPDYSHSSGIPFWEFHGNTTSLTLLCRESTVALWISLILPTKLQVLRGQGFFFSNFSITWGNYFRIQHTVMIQ